MEFLTGLDNKKTESNTEEIAEESDFLGPQQTREEFPVSSCL